MKNDAEPAMVCSPDDLVVWKDFPKGLRILLFERDAPLAAQTKLKLEAMEYIVSLFCKEDDALEVIANKADSFHIAIIDVTSGGTSCSFKFLEMARDLPTIVMSDVQCLSTMMKCIALGAAEFLHKPISEDKLRNVWQHVVHKAFNAGETALSKSLKPIKETVISMLQLKSCTQKLRIAIPSQEEDKDKEDEHHDTAANDKFPAPSTPQLGHGGRLLDDGDCHDQRECSMKNESTDNVNDSCQMRNSAFSVSKSVDNTSTNLTETIKEVSPSGNGEDAAEEEVDSADGPKTEECSAAIEGSMHPHMHKQENVESNTENPKKKAYFPSRSSYSHANRGNRKKGKVDWTSDLHRRFVQAVEQLGVDQAIPSKILELMKVEGLTRHNIASHLQKYRMHRRHILPKDDDKRWLLHRDSLPTTYMQMQKPLVAIPPYHSNYGFPPNPVYPAWGHPTYHPSGFQIWGHANYATWHPSPENWIWNSYPGIHADAWGCPVMPPYGQRPIPPQNPSVSSGMDVAADRAPKDSYDFLAEAAIDEAMKEAMSKPWLPLPLGLKPPSTESVLAELQRQGICTIPPWHRCPSSRGGPPH